MKETITKKSKGNGSHPTAQPTDFKKGIDKAKKGLKTAIEKTVGQFAIPLAESDSLQEILSPEPKINYLNELSNFIFASKYARYNEEKKRRETWDECVDRVKEMHLEKYAFVSKEYKKKIEWAFTKVKEKLIIPSMRSMQFGGKAIFAHNARMFNCLKRDTDFITSHGVKSFNDFNDGDITIVLTHNGNWKKAVVRNYGKDKLYPISIKRVNAEYKIWATKDHKWFLKNGTTTNRIKEKDILLGSKDIYEKFEYKSATIEEKLYWAYGFVYGDGTLVQNKNKEYKHSMVRLCGNKRKYLERFEELGFKSSSPLSIKGDSMVYTGTYLKTLPNPEIDSPKLIRAFVDGYLSTDGYYNRDYSGSQNNKYISIQATGEESIKFIRTCFPVAGIYIVSERQVTNSTNFGERNEETISFRIFHHPNNKVNSNSPFKVMEIGQKYVEEDVWCLEVEDDESFVLPFGLVTGNCSALHIDSLRSFAESFYLMMCGCGVTFGLSKKYMERIPDLVDATDKTGTVLNYVVEDNIEGWADSVQALMMCYFKNTPFSGRKLVFDFSRIRKKGTPLKTSGGKAPGHHGLKQSLQLIKKHLDHIIEHNNQTRLKTIDAYDILMHCSDAVLSGGIRRAACAIDFEIEDEDMIRAKTEFPVEKLFGFIKEKTDKKNPYHGAVLVNGIRYEVKLTVDEYKRLKKEKMVPWYSVYPWRARSNNSVRLLRGKFTEEKLKDIINATRMWGDPGFVFANNSDSLFNPCREVGMVPVDDDGVCGVMFCNLSSINGKKLTSIEAFLEAVEAATIIGTLQAGYTDFPYLSNVSEKLTRQASLLGVSITGIMENPDITLDEKNQFVAAKLATKINEEWTKIIGINPATRITCVKPEGCLSADTMVTTDNGILMLNEIGNSDGEEWQEHDIKVITDIGNEKSDKFHINGFTDTLKITFKSGLSVEGTLNHKFRILDQNNNYVWRTLNDIKINDKVLYRIGGYNKQDYFKLNKIIFNDESKQATRVKDIIQPETIDEDLGWFLGLYYGDGSTHTRTIRISGDDRERTNLEKAKTIVKKLFGVNCKIHNYEEDGDNRCQYYFNSTRLIKFLSANNLIKPKALEMEIPLAIRKSPKNVIEAFIDGYLAAGGCDIKYDYTRGRGNKSIVTTSKTTAEQLVIVLRAIGVDSKFRIMRPTKSSYGTNNRYWVSFRYGKDSDWSKQTKERQDDWNILKKLNLDNLYVDKVISIEKSKTITQDLSVPGTHTYLGNSYVTHNTSSLVLECSSGIHAHHARKYIRRVQVNKIDPVYKHFKKINPTLCEESIWSSTKADDVISFPIQVSEKAMIKEDLNAIEHLNIIQKTQLNWVLAGMRDSTKEVTHNISCTVEVDNSEWDTVIDYLYQNQEYFSAVSLLGKFTEKAIQQTPLEKIDSDNEAQWNQILNDFKPVDYTNLIEEEDKTTVRQTVACSGNACDTTFRMGD